MRKDKVIIEFVWFHASQKYKIIPSWLIVPVVLLYHSILYFQKLSNSHKESRAKYAVFLFIKIPVHTTVLCLFRKQKEQDSTWKTNSPSFPAEFKMFLIFYLLVSFLLQNLYVNEYAFNYRCYLFPNSVFKNFTQYDILKNKRNQKLPFLNIGFFTRCVKTVVNGYCFLLSPAS